MEVKNLKPITIGEGLMIFIFVDINFLFIVFIYFQICLLFAIKVNNNF